MKIGGLSKSEFNESLVSRFTNKCGEKDGRGCVPWTGKLGRNGYGVILLSGRGSKATSPHRVAWVLANGSIPPGMMVLHKCDNRACVNSEHMFLGSAQENTDDMVSKGRDVTWKGTPWPKPSATDAARIHFLRSCGFSQTLVADHIGLTPRVISKIERGKINYAQGAPV